MWLEWFREPKHSAVIFNEYVVSSMVFLQLLPRLESGGFKGSLTTSSRLRSASMNIAPSTIVIEKLQWRVAD